jgi:RNA polymerase sigma-70 factor (ECF subfamily)
MKFRPQPAISPFGKARSYGDHIAGGEHHRQWPRWPGMVGNSQVTYRSLAVMSDADLVRLHADGNNEALGVLCDRHGTRLRTAAARIAGQDADDAVQDGCLKAFRRADTFRGDSAVTTWLHRIVTNAALDIRRRNPLVAEPAGEPSSGSETGQADTRIDLWKQWSRISTDQQAVLLLVDIMGYPFVEAARILGVPEGTLKSRAARARAALAGKLEQTADQA